MNIANRTQEVKLFEQMVAGNFAQRVLLIEAESGFGKIFPIWENYLNLF